MFYRNFHLLCINQVDNDLSEYFPNYSTCSFFTEFIDGKCVLTSAQPKSMLSYNVGQEKGLPSHC